MIRQFFPVLVVSGRERTLLRPFETHWDRDYLWSSGIPPKRCINVEQLTVQRLRARVEMGIADDADAYVDNAITDWDGSLLRKPAPKLCDWDEKIVPGDRIEFRQPIDTSEADTFEPKETKPHWNEDLLQLSYGDIFFKRYRKNAWSQFPVLQAFQAAGWPRRIDNPFVGNPKRLSDTVRDLNKRVNGTLRFEMDGQGEGVVWLLCEEQNQQ